MMQRTPGTISISSRVDHPGDLPAADTMLYSTTRLAACQCQACSYSARLCLDAVWAFRGCCCWRHVTQVSVLLWMFVVACCCVIRNHQDMDVALVESPHRGSSLAKHARDSGITFGMLLLWQAGEAIVSLFCPCCCDVWWWWWWCN